MPPHRPLFRPLLQQEAVAHGFEQELVRLGKPDSYFVQLPKELQRKRDLLVESLAAVGMKPIVPEGTYYLIADLSTFSKPPQVSLQGCAEGCV